MQLRVGLYNNVFFTSGQVIADCELEAVRYQA